VHQAQARSNLADLFEPRNAGDTPPRLSKVQIAIFISIFDQLSVRSIKQFYKNVLAAHLLDEAPAV
jgi:hypothetical protein